MKQPALIRHLLALPCRLAAVEGGLLDLEEQRRERARELQARADALLLGGAIDGKNEALREAQLRQATTAERAALEEIEQQLARERAVLHHHQAEHASLRAIARLLAFRGDEE